jgi:hypothetical protein
MQVIRHEADGVKQARVFPQPVPEESQKGFVVAWVREQHPAVVPARNDVVRSSRDNESIFAHRALIGSDT